ncbi:phage DNA ejection protein [Citrobacter freundii]|uniref:phage DNA ejection protein n=1 Tax=Citrobacter freundii TaxID=546 RepID=UPI0028E0C07C|nr:phage DNA ejection protein [Citrobacter freundii]MDT9381231.1 phage DNA ejection protein [Citrobacter freundii]
MATFQLAGLPSMQVANQNAPGQPSLSSYDFSQRPNVGVQLAQGLGAVGQAIGQGEAAKRLSEFQQAFGQAYAAGDRDALRQLAATNPEQIETIRQGMGFVDADRNQAMGDMSARLNIAAAQGPDAVMRELATHQNTLQQIGVSPEQAWQTYQQSPEGFSQLTDLIGMHAVGPEKYFDIQDKVAGRDIDRGKLAETIRSNQASEAVQWANNNIAQQNVNLRRMELDDKKYDRQIANETNAIKLADLQDKRQQNQQAIEQAKRDKADAYNAGIDTLSRTIDTATKVLNSPGFTGYFGTNLNPLSSRYIPGTDAADTEALVDTLKSQGFMSGIQQMKGMGALSNAEGQKVMDAIGNLSASQSEKSARAAINTIISTTQRAQQRMQQKYGKDIQTQSSSQSQAQISDDDLINKYLGGK